MEEVVITGLGVVSPLGIGVDAMWASIEARESGVRVRQDLADAGWPTPYGGMIADFEPKQFVTPRKSLKVMAREIQLAFAAGEQAWEASELEAASVTPERMGVVCGAGLMYCGHEEVEAAFKACLDGDANRQTFDYDPWGPQGMRQMHPLWLLKYLPNMSACHIGIRRDARGPTNTIAQGDTSGLLALSEATDAIRRGAADVMLTGAASSRLYQTDRYWRTTASLWKAGEQPSEMMRPFDARRNGVVCGEGAAIFVLESKSHAKRRGAKPLARVASIASRTERTLVTGKFTGASVAASITGTLEAADMKANQIGVINAHGLSLPHEDACEAAAIKETLGDAPVTAPKSYFGNLGAASGAVELAIGLTGLQKGVVPPTLNYQVPDETCPINVVTELMTAPDQNLLTLNYNATGQAVAAIFSAE